MTKTNTVFVGLRIVPLFNYAVQVNFELTRLLVMAQWARTDFVCIDHVPVSALKQNEERFVMLHIPVLVPIS